MRRMGRRLTGAAVDIWDPAFSSFRVRILRVGVKATVVTLLAFLAFRLLPGGDSIPWHVFVPLWLTAAITGLVVWFLPWDEMLRRGRGRLPLYIWSVADILLITALIAWV